ncbi:MAG: hypothetical protein M3Q07_00240, partial [Pseudobdellovibrionaceae bacterium]|nr:hypothetical protein [Pseudobdellovibrionaceae bacterium]
YESFSTLRVILQHRPAFAGLACDPREQRRFSSELPFLQLNVCLASIPDAIAIAAPLDWVLKGRE